MDNEVKWKSHKCPSCGGKVVEIVYGMPSHEQLIEEEKGNIVLGGCCITVDDDGNIMGRNGDAPDVELILSKVRNYEKDFIYDGNGFDFSCLHHVLKMINLLLNMT